MTIEQQNKINAELGKQTRNYCLTVKSKNPFPKAPVNRILVKLSTDLESRSLSVEFEIQLAKVELTKPAHSHNLLWASLTVDNVPMPMCGVVRSWLADAKATLQGMGLEVGWEESELN